MANEKQDVGVLFRAALRTWGSHGPRQFLFFLRAALAFYRARQRRKRNARLIDGSIPSVVAVSPTARCNYNCKGCYSRGRPTGGELSTQELDLLLTEAGRLGVQVIVWTGGEPLLRNDIPGLIRRHRRLFFVLITNGALLTKSMCRRIASGGNTVVLVSIEGTQRDTDGRRGPGAHKAALRAFDLLRKAKICYGFSSTVTTANVEHLGSDAFVDEMLARGCSLGYYNEYVPCGPRPRLGWALDESMRAGFRKRVLDLRRRKKMVLTHFPDDEYAADGRCSAAGRESLHINAQGDVEPCPFAPVAAGSVRRGGLMAACLSPLLRAIRERPSLLRRKESACALFEHIAEIEELKRQVG